MSTRKTQLLRRAAGNERSRAVAITREEKALRAFLESAGGADWNAAEGEPGHVENRTHYEETKVVNEPLNITWDGNTDGLVGVIDEYYKISDLVLSDEQIKTITEINNYGEQFVVSDNWDEMLSNGEVTPELVATHDCIYVRKAGVEFYGMVFPEPGIYAFSDGEYYIASITTTEPVEHTKTIVKKLDMKFLPDGYPYEETETDEAITVVWDGDTTGRTGFNTNMGIAYRVSDIVLTPERIRTAAVYFDVDNVYLGEAYGEDYWSMLVETQQVTPQYIISDFMLYVFEDTDHIFEGEGRVDGDFQKGIYFLVKYNGNYLSKLVVPAYTKSTVHKLDLKFIPEILFTGVMTEEGWYKYTCNVCYAEARNALINGATARMILVNGDKIIHPVLQQVWYRDGSVNLDFYDIKDLDNAAGIIRYNEDGSVVIGVE